MGLRITYLLFGIIICCQLAIAESTSGSTSESLFRQQLAIKVYRIPAEIAIPKDAEITLSGVIPLSGCSWATTSPAERRAADIALMLANKEFQQLADAASAFDMLTTIGKNTSSDLKDFAVTKGRTIYGSEDVRYFPALFPTDEVHKITMHEVMPKKGMRWQIERTTDGVAIRWPLALVDYNQDFNVDVTPVEGSSTVASEAPKTVEDGDYWTLAVCNRGESYAAIFPRGKEPTGYTGKFSRTTSSDWISLVESVKGKGMPIDIFIHPGLDTGPYPSDWFKTTNPGHLNCLPMIGGGFSGTLPFEVQDLPLNLMNPLGGGLLGKLPALALPTAPLSLVSKLPTVQKIQEKQAEIIKKAAQPVQEAVKSVGNTVNNAANKAGNWIKRRF